MYGRKNPSSTHETSISSLLKTAHPATFATHLQIDHALDRLDPTQESCPRYDAEEYGSQATCGLDHTEQRHCVFALNGRSRSCSGNRSVRCLHLLVEIIYAVSSQNAHCSPRGADFTCPQNPLRKTILKPRSTPCRGIRC